MEISLENLQLIPDLLEKLEKIDSKVNNLQILLTPDLNLTKPTHVAKFLKVSKPTLYKWVNEGILKEGIHFNRVLNQKRGSIVFVESAIIKYKEEL